jgi:hypothetical protein
MFIVTAVLATFALNSYASERLDVLKVAKGYSHVREKTNRNDAPEITKFLKYVGLPPQVPYCLAFANFCWGQVAKKNPYPRVGGTIYFMEKVKAHPLRYKVYTADDFRRGQGMAGGIGIYFHNSRSGHAVLFDKQIDLHNFSTVEGNTVGVDTKDAAEQRGEGKTSKKQGVYCRVRSNRSSAGMQFKGIVVPR